ncbi:MAG: hypothetical protein JOS17DRAFT_773995 [Linnemannia elongata]|nr:MAG: hypothetical protein JOS17DRAFT_773995 [Linnemannia elongata]
MNKQVLAAHIHLVTSKIATLELAEVHYVRALHVPSNDSRGQYVFNATLAMQAERQRLFAVRTEIYDLSILHRNLMTSLQAIDAPLAKRLGFSIYQSMQLRLNHLRREELGYHAQQGPVLEGSMHHADNNRILIARITASFDPAAGY